jgi:hypothetical protein
MKNCTIEIAVRAPEGLIARRDFPMEEFEARSFSAELNADGFDIRFERMLDTEDAAVPPTNDNAGNAPTDDPEHVLSSEPPKADEASAASTVVSPADGEPKTARRRKRD